jgi:hypothetical protein
MSFYEARLRSNGSSVIETMLKRLAEEEQEELLLGRKTVGNRTCRNCEAARQGGLVLRA